MSAAKPRPKAKAKAKPRTKRAPAPTGSRASRVVSALGKEKGVTVESGWGTGHLVLKHRAKIFVILSGTGGLVAKLPRTRVDQLVKGGVGVRFDPRKNGRVMKEWLVADDQTMWLTLAREAFEYVGGVSRTRAS